MTNIASGGPTSYQERVSNTGRIFFRSSGNSYGRVRCRGFNLTKPKVRRKCEALGSNIYLIGDTQQVDKYNKTTEEILNHIQVIFNKGNYVKGVVEELNH